MKNRDEESLKVKCPLTFVTKFNVFYLSNFSDMIRLALNYSACFFHLRTGVVFYGNISELINFFCIMLFSEHSNNYYISTSQNSSIRNCPFWYSLPIRQQNTKQTQ